MLLWSVLLVIAVGAIIVEVIIRRKRNLALDLAESISSITLGGFNLISKLIFQPITIFFIAVTVPFSVMGLKWSVSTVIACFLLNDIVGYWMHRFAHRTGWGWMDHIAHHSDQQFTFTTSLRLGCLGPITPVVLAPVPLILIGFPPEMIFVVHSAGATYQFFLHTEVVGAFPRPIEYIFNTPTHHRIHHAKNEDLLDCNYGGVFIIWDRLFGTFKSGDASNIVYGTSDGFEARNPVRIALEPALLWFFALFRHLVQPREFWALVFGPPQDHWSNKSPVSKLPYEAEFGQRGDRV